MSKIVLALGGNALGSTPSEQKEIVKKTAKVIVDLYLENNDIVIVHGNGPQVGWINNSFMNAFKEGVSKEILPFPECGAMSQGYIGYHIQNAIQNEFIKRNENGKVISLVSQMVVNKNDQGFKNPTKPIGDFMTETEAKKLAKDNGWIVKEDAGRGWRRVIASPKPIEMPSLDIVKTLINDRTITIVGGGGGIPVIKGNEIVGVDAVIDKDFTASFIAKSINAEKFVILTAVDQIKLNFGKDSEESLSEVNLVDLDKYISDEQFAPGSMLPKILATIDFVKESNKPAFIGKLEQAALIVKGEAGTKIIK
ncbi:MAG: carbamate kinase [Mycoplasmataceae bacterium]|nr:carbamate kinase [Mycoplasmataceae bacterium]